MADYGVGRTGGSLRDALNQLYPMTGMGEYNTMFPPQMLPPNVGSEPTGSPPVPIPRQRPPMPPVNLAPPVPPAQGPAPGLALPQGIQPPAVSGQINQLGKALAPSGYAYGPQIAGGVSAPIGPNTYATAGGEYGRFGPGDYAARLGLVRQF